jgi:hypothetical protein
LYGRVGSVRGFDASGVVARIDGDLHGAQVVGGFSYIGGELHGVSLTGGVNCVRGESYGVQIAGLVNYDQGRFTGFQTAGLVNYALGGFTGVQLTSVYNLNNQNGRWAQIAGIVNATAGSFDGVQLSGGINLAHSELRGAQIGLFSAASRVDGAQVGLCNVADRVHGTQIGGVNIARQVDGVPVGVVNWAGNGEKGWVAMGSSLAAFSAGFYTKVNDFYSMFTLGIGDLKDSQGDTGFIGWHYGYEFPITERWGLGTDLGMEHMFPRKSDDPSVNDRLHFALQARALAIRHTGGHWSFFAGGGMSLMFSEYSSKASSDWDPLVVGGVIFR